jgi:hypothetical protein
MSHWHVQTIVRQPRWNQDGEYIDNWTYPDGWRARAEFDHRRHAGLDAMFWHCTNPHCTAQPAPPEYDPPDPDAPTVQSFEQGAAAWNERENA